MANHGCYVCGRGDRLVNLDTQIVGEGILALCAVCIEDAALAAKLTFNHAEFAELRQELAEARTERDVAKARTERFEAALAYVNDDKPKKRK